MMSAVRSRDPPSTTSTSTAPIVRNARAALEQRDRGLRRCRRGSAQSFAAETWRKQTRCRYLPEAGLPYQAAIQPHGWDAPCSWCRRVPAALPVPVQFDAQMRGRMACYTSANHPGRGLVGGEIAF